MKAVNVLVALAVLTTLSACTQDGTSDDQQSRESATSSFDQALNEALGDPGVAERQLQALRSAAEKDAMSYDELSALLEDTFACFDAAGIAYKIDPDDHVASGFSVPRYSFAGGKEAQADTCQDQHSEYAFRAYQTQSLAVELSDAALEKRRPEVLACLRDLGVRLDDDASLEELRRLSMESFIAAGDDPAAVMCTDDV